MMNVGALTTIITIQRRLQLGVTEIGEPNWVWQDWRPDIWCEPKVIRGQEQFDPTTKKRYAQDVWQFYCRHEEVIGASAAMRVWHEGQVFLIQNLMPDPKSRDFCTIQCTLDDQAVENMALIPAIKDAIATGYVGEDYEVFTVSAAGGIEPYAFTTERALPPGLSLDQVAGLVSGRPTEHGLFTVTILVTDAAGSAESLPPFQIEIKEA